MTDFSKRPTASSLHRDAANSILIEARLLRAQVMRAGVVYVWSMLRRIVASRPAPIQNAPV